MREDNIRRDSFFQLFKEAFYFSADVREETGPKTLDDDVFCLRGGQEELGAHERLGSSVPVGAEDYPTDVGVLPFGEKTQDGSATADLDVVAMRSNTEDLEGAMIGRGEFECQHARRVARGALAAVGESRSGRDPVLVAYPVAPASV